MKTIGFLTLFTFLVTSNTQASLDAIPENEINIPPSTIHIKDFDAVGEYDFNFVTKTLHKIYAPVIKEKSNVDFVMNADWEDGTVNAYATREVSTWTVHINGGIARSKGMTKDSLALIVCHEIGHHLGGAPRTFLYDGWPSAEGQADYWASSKCLKRYYDELKNEEVSISEGVPEKILQDCSNIYKVYGEFKICVRTLMASLDFSQFLNNLPEIKTPVSIDLTDSRQVKGTNTNDYPRPQCRFDTLYQGALCTIGYNVATSETDAKIGHCNDTTRPGARPRCWYKPQ